MLHCLQLIPSRTLLSQVEISTIQMSFNIREKHTFLRRCYFKAENNLDKLYPEESSPSPEYKVHNYCLLCRQLNVTRDVKMKLNSIPGFLRIKHWKSLCVLV